MYTIYFLPKKPAFDLSLMLSIHTCVRRIGLKIPIVNKRVGSNCIDQAASNYLFTGAIPLLPNAGTFACCVSALDWYVPP